MDRLVGRKGRGNLKDINEARSIIRDQKDAIILATAIKTKPAISGLCNDYRLRDLYVLCMKAKGGLNGIVMIK